MKKLIVLIAFSGAIAVLSLVLTTYSRNASADSSSYCQERNFGKVTSSEILSHTFTLSAKPARRMRVMGIESKCSCTVPSNSIVGRTIGNSTSLPVPVTFRPSGLSGHVERQIVLLLEDLDTGEHVVAHWKLIAEVEPPYVLTPATIDFGEVELGSQRVKEFHLLHRNLDGPQIASFHPSCPDFSVTKTTDAKGSRGERYSVTFRPGSHDRTRQISSCILIELADGEVAAVSLRGRAVMPYSVEPHALAITDGMKVSDRKLVLTTLRPSEIPQVRCNDDRIITTWERKQSYNHILQVNVQSTTSVSSALHIDLDFESDEGDLRHIQVPVPVTFLAKEN